MLQYNKSIKCVPKGQSSPRDRCFFQTLICNESTHFFIYMRGEIMDMTRVIIFLANGAVAGCLAGTLMKGGEFGLLVATKDEAC